VRLSSGGRALERLAGPNKRTAGTGTPSRWRTRRAGNDPWARSAPAPDQTWLREPAGRGARNVLQQSLLFPLARTIARPRVFGADDLMSAPQPALLAPNHASDIDTPIGNWCDGVTWITRVRSDKPQIAAPESVTGSVVRPAPCARNNCRAPA